MAIPQGGSYVCVTKYNVGDFVNGIGVDIPPSATVQVENANGTRCGSSTSYNGKCCWKGNTSETGQCNSANGSYSGCTRTVCTWAAANAICSALGGSLPTGDELIDYAMNYSKGKNNNGLQFCDSSSGKGSSQCKYIAGPCVGAHENQCRPEKPWANLDVPATSAWFMALENGVASTGHGIKTLPRSVRCKFSP
jgi:hypothetical protein